MTRTSTLVIGAGLSGLTLAQALRQSGLDVSIIEKSGGIGGRLATRQDETGSFDHGAQYVTARTAAFQSFIDKAANLGKAAAWNPRGKDRRGVWFCGLPGMNALTRPLTDDLAIRFGTEVTRIEKEEEGFTVYGRSDGQDEWSSPAARIITAIPAPQAARLLAPLDPAFDMLQSVVMAPCLAVMVSFSNTIPLPVDMIRPDRHPILAWAARNGSKPGRRDAANENGGRGDDDWIIHATPQWSRRHLEQPPDVFAHAVLEAFVELVARSCDQAIPVARHVTGHRWRHALCEKPLGTPFMASRDRRLFACGDWCLEGRAESAFTSGKTLADHLLAQM